jgi:hypothetical protein
MAVLLVLLAVRVEHIIRVRAGILIGLGAGVEGDLSSACASVVRPVCKARFVLQRTRK